LRRIKSSVAQKTRRDVVQQELIASCGGVCVRCRKSFHPNIYDFHHTDPTVKEFNLDRSNFGRNVKKLFDEAKKCVLVCANCHREIHTYLDKRFLITQPNPNPLFQFEPSESTLSDAEVKSLESALGITEILVDE
jgi:predicted HNH restriction endonuclease